MDKNREHFAELNLVVKGTTKHDAARIVQTAAAVLQWIEGLEVRSAYIVQEYHVDLKAELEKARRTPRWWWED